MADCGKIPSISELPEEIMHKILSFLRNREAIRAGSLSKDWYRAFQTLPNLVFDRRAIDFYEELTGSGGERVIKRLRSELNYVISTLQRYYLGPNIVLNTFKLELDWSELDWSKLDWWDDNCIYECIIIAAEKGVRNLHFSNGGVSLFDLPVKVLEASTLVELSLGRCRLKYHETLMWPNLKRLCLDKVELDQLMLDNILRSCPLIETVDICLCSISNKPLLPDQTTGMEATPDPEFCSGFHLPVSQCQSLRSLSISLMEIDDNFFIDLSHKFPHLEHLSVEQCQTLRTFRISSGSLKKLKLAYILLSEVQFDLPSLVLFEFEGFRIPWISFTAASGRWTSRLTICCDGIIDISWFLKLKEFLKSQHRSELRVTVYFEDNVAFKLDEVSTDVEVEEIAEFCILSWAKLQPADYGALAHKIMDGIFWTCHPRVITTEWYEYRLGYTESIYKMLVLENKPCHFCSSKGNFWRSRCESIKIFDYELGLCMLLDETLDWNGFSEVLKAQDCAKVTVSFNLEWRTCELPEMLQSEL
ncbi:OLC1v1001784C1 [Oldenlandia corymbosa var. corymbosa]|uniref:OLC1v1001784C1 n=1 Tax=Oldenlandia corymbosa var. corymbosa TaxID=529605 RepID=A0AAV1D791_OLDCO|nr:OLC1v1001784C1 [Oldenlandia corymbosa var. corymbosa]